MGPTCTLNSTYNEKKYAKILLYYGWLFIKGDIIIGEWGIFGVEIFFHYSQFFIKGDIVIGRVECNMLPNTVYKMYKFSEAYRVDYPFNTICASIISIMRSNKRLTKNEELIVT